MDNTNVVFIGDNKRLLNTKTKELELILNQSYPRIQQGKPLLESERIWYALDGLLL